MDRCGWTALLPGRVARPALQGAVRARYAVVGAGFTGLAAARRLAELDPAAEVVVLEAGVVGEGASGRNSGFAGPTDIPGGASAAAVAAQARLDRFGSEGFGWLVALMERHGIACGLRPSGRIKGAATARGEAAVQEMLATVRALGIPHALLGPDEMERRIGTRHYRLGLFTEGGFLLDPAALVRGLAESLPEGVRLHEGSAVRRLVRDGAGWRLVCDGGEVSAGTVVLAANAGAAGLGWLGDRVVTIHTYAGLSAAMGAADAAQLGEMEDWGLLPSHRLGTTVRRVGAGRLMVRSMYAHKHGLPHGLVAETLRSCFHRRYPGLSHVELEFVWGGMTALTMNGAPAWGKLAEGLYGFAGCNGSGIVKGTVLGKRLAELIRGEDASAEIYAAFGRANWVVPEPFRSIGFKVLSAKGRREAGAEA